MSLVNRKSLVQVIWWVSAIVLMLLAGILYRVTSRQLKAISQIQIKLPIPFSEFPLDIGDWTGQDVPIPSNIQRVADNDDFLSRVYTNRQSRERVNVYVAYSARPRTMLGHRPENCYVGSGWILDNTESATVMTDSGLQIACLLHHFQRPVPDNDKIVVLNFYILNGQITSDESSFSGVGWRTPNIAGNPARYVAQVQISSVFENSVRLAAGNMVDMILDYLPDKDGNVRAAQSISTAAEL